MGEAEGVGKSRASECQTRVAPQEDSDLLTVGFYQSKFCRLRTSTRCVALGQYKDAISAKSFRAEVRLYGRC